MEPQTIIEMETGPVDKNVQEFQPASQIGKPLVDTGVSNNTRGVETAIQVQLRNDEEKHLPPDSKPQTPPKKSFHKYAAAGLIYVLLFVIIIFEMVIRSHPVIKIFNPVIDNSTTMKLNETASQILRPE